MSRPRFTPEANRDLREILEYFGEGSPIGQKLSRRSRPGAWRWPNLRGSGDLAPGLRAGLVRGYLILYRDEGSQIQIVRILHGRRDVQGLFRKGKK